MSPSCEQHLVNYCVRIILLNQYSRFKSPIHFFHRKDTHKCITSLIRIHAHTQTRTHNIVNVYFLLLFHFILLLIPIESCLIVFYYLRYHRYCLFPIKMLEWKDNEIQDFDIPLCSVNNHRFDRNYRWFKDTW